MTVLVSSELGQRLDGDSRIDDAVTWLLAEELDDGGWNCEPHTSMGKHASFHTTISTLEGLAAYRHSGGAVPVAAAEARGREFLLMHSLYRSHRTGSVAHPTLAQVPVPAPMALRHPARTGVLPRRKLPAGRPDVDGG